MDDSYIDYLANINNSELGESLKDLMRDYYEFFMPYLDELYHVEANFIYLNMICGVSQARIASIVGISQYGVSKRVKAGLNKLTNLIKIPEKDKKRVRYDLEFLLPLDQSELIFNYYFFRTFALTGRMLGLDSSLVNSQVDKIVKALRQYEVCDNLKSFIATYINTHGLKGKTFTWIKQEQPLHYHRMMQIRDGLEDYKLMSAQARRYATYLDSLVHISSYGDYTFKLYDRDRTNQAKEPEIGRVSA